MQLSLVILPLLLSFGVSARPLPPLDNPVHPYLAPVANLHLDSYYSKVSNNRAPASGDINRRRFDFGETKLKIIRKLHMAMCLNFMTDADGEFYGFCSVPQKTYVGGINFEFVHFDSKTFQKKATYTITKVELSRLIKNDLPLNLGYINMDNLGRIIIADENHVIKFVGLDKDKKKFEVSQSFGLNGLVPAGSSIAQVTPDYQNRYWFMSLGKMDKKTHKIIRDAYVGYYDLQTGASDLKVYYGKVIENGFAVDESGTYVLTDHEQQKLEIDSSGKIREVWSEKYERASKPKPGTISLYGSGASPALVKDDLLVITDNADERVNLLVYKRRNQVQGNRLVCKVPLFKPNKSANENSVVAYGNSIIAQNWYNAPSYFGKLSSMEPGIVRIDIREDRSGCDIVWENNQVAATSTMKLSTGSGYLYAPVDVGNKHYLDLIDFETGKIDHQIFLNKGLSGRYMAAPVGFGPNDEVIQPHFSGMTVIKENPPSP